jgi:hypothetical protein
MSKTNIAWLAGYLLVLAAVIWAVVATRQWAIGQLNNDTARAQREEFLDSLRREQAAGDPIQRRIPESNEPPELVMLRDRFWVVMTAACVFTSLFYGFAMYVGRGMRGSSDAPTDHATRSHS